MKRKRPFPNDIEEPQVPGWRRGPAAGLGGKDWGPPGSVTSGPRRRSAKLCTVSSGSLPRGAISSLSPAQNSGLEKGAAGRSSPLHGGGNREEGPRHSPLVRPLSLGRAGGLEPRGRGRVRLGQRGLRGAGGRRGGAAGPEAGGQRVQGAAHVQEPVSGRGVVPPDGQHFRVQAELRRLLPTRPRAEEKLRANRPPNTPPPPLSPRDAAQPRRAVHSRSPGAGSGRPALPPAEFLEVQVQRQRRLGHARSGSSLPDARCPPPGPPAGQGYTRRRRLSLGEGSGRPSAGTRGGLEEAPAATHLGGAGGPAQVVTGGQAADASTQHDHGPAHWGLGESSGARTGWPGGPCLRKLRGVRAPAAADCFRAPGAQGPPRRGPGEREGGAGAGR